MLHLSLFCSLEGKECSIAWIYHVCLPVHPSKNTVFLPLWAPGRNAAVNAGVQTPRSPPGVLDSVLLGAYLGELLILW